MTARGWTAFATVSVLLGTSCLFIKVAVQDGVPPASVAWVRVAPAAAVLLALAAGAGLLRSLAGRGRANRRLGRALVVTYVNPVVAVALGTLVLGESLGPGALAGLVLMLIGSWLSTERRPPTRSLRVREVCDARR